MPCDARAVRAIGISTSLLAAGAPFLAGTALAGTPSAPQPEQAGSGDVPTKEPAALDLASLERRLKETSAIGIFTKLTLKNQIDELLDQFRDYYQGRIKTSLADLRQPYDLLILKVLTLLQDADPSLARAIGDSREAIWDILSDSAKFSRYRS